MEAYNNTIATGNNSPGNTYPIRIPRGTAPQNAPLRLNRHLPIGAGNMFPPLGPCGINNIIGNANATQNLWTTAAAAVCDVNHQMANPVTCFGKLESVVPGEPVK